MFKSLEDELNFFIAKHKLKILKLKMTKYYELVENNQIDIPDFLQDRMKESKAELLADRDVRNLLLEQDFTKFNNLYERAWVEFAPQLK